ncbi:MAG TPA: hypothetical protein VM487_02585 [Phycisphaerae bacterium]|nr:hypothetical protein [Phycisphaerae bacterium]
MSSSVTEVPAFRRAWPVWCFGGALLACFWVAGLFVGGCQEGRHDLSARYTARVYPPAPQAPRVVALGTLRGAPPATKAQVELSMFLFGVEPPSPLAITNPTDLAARDDQLLICDNALSVVFRWDAASGELSEDRFHPSRDYAFAVDVAANGDRLICDRGGVVGADATGNVYVEYAIEPRAFKPAGVLAVGDQVWITNLAAHRIEVFDAASGKHLRSIGEHGRGPAQFALPRGLARTPDGNVCVVDVLNNRVQVLDQDGNWVRDIGRPGTAVGSFGRPRDVAVAPDGTIFVTDAFSQRVHAFAPDGEPLLAFGEPGSGVGELALPNGIAVTTIAPQAEHELPPEMSPAYYVLVAEQLNRPGVRVYAWLGNYEPDGSTPPPPTDSLARLPDGKAGPAGPHWDAEGCATCHEEDEDRLLPIATDEVNDVCLECHEEHEDTAWTHPVVDSEATGSGLQVPADWPLDDGQLVCLTCHDIKRQCSVDARRADAGVKLLRRYDPLRTRSLCTTCHIDPDWTGSPHTQLDSEGQPNSESCLVCHKKEPEIPSDGVRRFEPKLREALRGCLTCHVRHWDYFPAEHLGRLVPPELRRSAKLPLAGDRIACYTCHNPHEGGLFPPGSELARRARSPAEAAYRLRADRPRLCLQCHEK